MDRTDVCLQLARFIRMKRTLVILMFKIQSLMTGLASIFVVLLVRPVQFLACYFFDVTYKWGVMVNIKNYRWYILWYQHSSITFQWHLTIWWLDILGDTLRWGLDGGDPVMRRGSVDGQRTSRHQSSSAFCARDSLTCHSLKAPMENLYKVHTKAARVFSNLTLSCQHQ